VVPIAPVPVRGRPDTTAGRAASEETETLAPETAEAEFVSLEDADAEQQGKKSAVADADVGDDVDTGEDIEDGDEEPFIEEQEEEDTDVSEIIGGDIADEEES